MGHHVTYMEILVMAYGRKHRQRELSDHGGKSVIIKAGQIQLSPSATQDKDGIILLPAVQDRIHGCDYRLRAVRALHQCRIKLGIDLETIWIFMEMPHEVTIARCVLG